MSEEIHNLKSFDSGTGSEVKGSDTKPDDLSLTPGSHMFEEEIPSSCPQTLTCVPRLFCVWWPE